MTRHSAGVGALVGHELEHGREKIGNAAALLFLKVVLLAQHVGESPVTKAVNIAQLSAAVEDLLGPFARETQRLGEGPEEFDDLGDVIVVLAILSTGLRVE